MIVDLTRKETELDLERHQICAELANNYVLAARILGLSKVVLDEYTHTDLARFIKIICKSKK